MDGGYPLQMDFSLSSSSKRFWDLWSGHGHWVFFFCISGPALAVVGLRGDFKRGIIWNGEGGMKAICVYLCARVCVREREREREHASVVPPVSVQKKKKKKPAAGPERMEGFLRRLPASALLRSPLILPTWTLVHHNLHANRLTQYAKIIQPAQDWQWSRKSLNGQGKVPSQNPD